MNNMNDTESNLNQMKDVHQCILRFIDNDDNQEENYHNVVIRLENINFISDTDNIRQILYLLAQLSDCHYRKSNFFGKIEKLLEFLKDSIQKRFSRDEIFNIFRKNKRILLFLFEQGLLILDQPLIKLFCTNEYRRYRYISYFSPEIKPLITFDEKKKYFSLDLSNLTKESQMPHDCLEVLKKELITDLPENFYDKRKIGENDTKLCRLIRNDSLDLFIEYMKQKSIPFNTYIMPSIYETHRKIDDISKKVNLISYALFFGSIQIFSYLQQNYADQHLDLFNLSVYSNNISIIKQVENIHQLNINTEIMFKEAIECHHNDIANYIQCNYMDQQQNLPHYDLEKNIYTNSIHYRNFSFFPGDFKNPFLFYYFCKYNYVNIVENYLKTTSVDLNKLYILNFYFFNNVSFLIFS